MTTPVTLSPDECRVLGVLIEKAQTTPAQYPLTLNGLTLGCNQRNNREPVADLTEDRVMEALDALRNKGLVREALLAGSRVNKFRHVAREALGVSTPELVVLAELLLRGPQSVGEIRGRASRMHPLDSLETTQGVLDGLRRRPDGMAALVAEVPPQHGSRALRYAQLLCPGLHPERPTAGATGGVGIADQADIADKAFRTAPGFVERLDRAEHEIDALKRALRGLAAALGTHDPLDGQG